MHTMHPNSTNLQGIRMLLPNVCISTNPRTLSYLAMRSAISFCMPLVSRSDATRLHSKVNHHMDHDLHHQLQTQQQSVCGNIVIFVFLFLEISKTIGEHLVINNY